MLAPEPYGLLPLWFRRFPQDQTLLVNQAGEYLFLSGEQFQSFHGGTLEPHSPLAMDLESRHFLYRGTPSLALELLATKLRTRKGYLRHFTSLHMVVLTTACNCHCRYCQASSTAPGARAGHMGRETARAVVEMIFHSPSPTIKVEFQGGEPLLNWPVLQEIVTLAERRNRRARRRLEFVVCTNLTRLDREKLRFLQEHEVAISTSLDGPRELHDRHRICRDGSSSYGALLSGLELVREAGYFPRCSALLTITRDHLSRLPEVLEEYRRQGFEGIFLRPLNPYGSAQENRQELAYPPEDFVAAYRGALSHLLEWNRQGTRFVEYYTALLLARILTPFATGFVDLQSPAGAGISGVIYDHDGEVYPADEARMLARTGDRSFRLGNVHTDSYEAIFGGEVLRRLTRQSCVETLPGCAACAYHLFCGGDPIRHYVESGDPVGHRATSEFCGKHQGLFDHLFSLLQRSDPETMATFWSWLTRRSRAEVML